MKAIYTLVGMTHRDSEAFVRSLPSGETLVLVREPDNAHDPRAVMVWAQGRHVGYVAAKENAGLAAKIDAAGHRSPHFEGPIRRARLVLGRWPRIEVDE